MSGAGNGGWLTNNGIYTRPLERAGAWQRCLPLCSPTTITEPHGLEAHVRASRCVYARDIMLGRTGQRLPFAQLAHLANLEGLSRKRSHRRCALRNQSYESNGYSRAFG